MKLYVSLDQSNGAIIKSHAVEIVLDKDYPYLRQVEVFAILDERLPIYGQNYISLAKGKFAL